MNRREFTRIAAAGTAAVGLSPTIITGSGWKGANDRVNVAVIGIRGQGENHIAGYGNSRKPGSWHYVMSTAIFSMTG